MDVCEDAETVRIGTGFAAMLAEEIARFRRCAGAAPSLRELVAATAGGGGGGGGLAAQEQFVVPAADTTGSFVTLHGRTRYAVPAAPGLLCPSSMAAVRRSQEASHWWTVAELGAKHAAPQPAAYEGLFTASPCPLRSRLSEARLTSTVSRHVNETSGLFQHQSVAATPRTPATHAAPAGLSSSATSHTRTVRVDLTSASTTASSSKEMRAGHRSGAAASTSAASGGATTTSSSALQLSAHGASHFGDIVRRWLSAGESDRETAKARGTARARAGSSSGGRRTAGDITFESDADYVRYYLRLMNLQSVLRGVDAPAASDPYAHPLRSGAFLWEIVRVAAVGLTAALQAAELHHSADQRTRARIAEAASHLHAVDVRPFDALRREAGTHAQQRSTATTVRQPKTLHEQALFVYAKLAANVGALARANARARPAAHAMAALIGSRNGSRGGGDALHEIMAGRTDAVWAVAAELTAAFFVADAMPSQTHRDASSDRRPGLAAVGSSRDADTSVSIDASAACTLLDGAHPNDRNVNDRDAALESAVCQFLIDLQVLPEPQPAATADAVSARPWEAPYFPDARTLAGGAHAASRAPVFHASILADGGAGSQHSMTAHPPHQAFAARVSPLPSLFAPSVYLYLRNGTVLCDVAVRLLGDVGEHYPATGRGSLPADEQPPLSSFSRNPRVERACRANLRLAMALFCACDGGLATAPHAARGASSLPKGPYFSLCRRPATVEALLAGNTSVIAALLEAAMRCSFGVPPRRPGDAGYIPPQYLRGEGMSTTDHANHHGHHGTMLNVSIASDGGGPTPVHNNSNASLRGGFGIRETQSFSSPLPATSNGVGGGIVAGGVGGSTRPQPIPGAFASLDGASLDDTHNSSLYERTAIEAAPASANRPPLLLHTAMGGGAAAGDPEPRPQQAQPHPMAAVSALTAPSSAAAEQLCGPLGDWVLRRLRASYRYAPADGSFVADFSSIASGTGLFFDRAWYTPGAANAALRTRTAARSLLFADGVVLSDLLRALLAHSPAACRHLDAVQRRPKTTAARRFNVRRVIDVVRGAQRSAFGRGTDVTALEERVAAGDLEGIATLLRAMADTFDKGAIIDVPSLTAAPHGHGQAQAQRQSLTARGTPSSPLLASPPFKPLSRSGSAFSGSGVFSFA